MPKRFAYIAIGPHVWGKGDTEQIALERMKKSNNGHRPAQCYVYQCDPRATVDEVSGGISTPRGGLPPKEVYRRGIKK
jgi:hypothetical protein